jgi:hypothetical protein
MSLPCCIGDGGRPSVVALQGVATNHPKVRRLRAVCAERCGRRRACEHVRCDSLKANVSEPLMKCRKRVDDIKTRHCVLSWDEPGECLFIGQVVSGMKAARAWVRLLCGTWEPVVSRDDRPVVCDLRLVVSGKAPSGGHREGSCTGARHRGGPSGSSVEGSVMGLERSGRAVQARFQGNHELVGGTCG